MALTREWLRRRLGVFDIYALVHSDSQSTFYFVLGFIAYDAGQYARSEERRVGKECAD